MEAIHKFILSKLGMKKKSQTKDGIKPDFDKNFLIKKIKKL